MCLYQIKVVLYVEKHSKQMHFNSFFHFSKQKQDRDKRLQAAAKKRLRRHCCQCRCQCCQKIYRPNCSNKSVSVKSTKRSLYYSPFMLSRTRPAAINNLLDASSTKLKSVFLFLCLSDYFFIFYCCFSALLSLPVLFPSVSLFWPFQRYHQAVSIKLPLVLLLFVSLQL